MTDESDIEALAARIGVGPVRSIEARTDLPGTTGRLYEVDSSDGPLIAKVSEGRAHEERTRREVEVLGTLGSRLEGLAPRLLGGDVRTEPPRRLLLLERIDGHSGDSLRGVDRAALEAVVDRMRIAWRIREDDPDLRPLALPRWGRGTADQRPHRRRADRLRRRGRTMLERFPGSASVHGPILEETERRFEALASAEGCSPPSLIHGDLHLDNVIFSVDGPRVLDWQTTSIGDPVDDVVRLGLESGPEVTLDDIESLCRRVPGIRTTTSHVASRVVLAYAGLVSGLAGRPGLEPGTRDHRFAIRMLAPDHVAFVVRAAIERLDQP